MSDLVRVQGSRQSVRGCMRVVLEMDVDMCKVHVMDRVGGRYPYYPRTLFIIMPFQSRTEKPGECWGFLLDNQGKITFTIIAGIIARIAEII